MCVFCFVVGVKPKVCRYTLHGLQFILGHSQDLRIYSIEQLNKWRIGKDLVGKVCGLVQVSYGRLDGGTEESLEEYQNAWYPAQDLNQAATEHKSTASNSTNSFCKQYEYIWGLYKEQNLVKLKLIYASLNIANILLNGVVAVFKLSHMPCFVQIAFYE